MTFLIKLLLVILNLSKEYIIAILGFIVIASISILRGFGLF